jgi:hypothetical protein
MRESTRGVNANRVLKKILRSTGIIDPARLPFDQRPVGDNLLISRRRKAQESGVVNSRHRGFARPRSNRSARAGTGNRVIHKFSPGGQGTLYPVKLFGIITLVRALPQLSTVACPLYGECGDLIAQSFLRRFGTELQ